MDSITSQLPLLIPLLLGALAVWMLLPRDGVRPVALGALCGVAALLGLARHFAAPADDMVRNVLFYLFGGGAIASGLLMITDRNPVYAALWFALVTLCTCGLFLLNSAPFLAAATVIVYAGAIVVTFVFVIMLAQQAGAAGYDRRAYQPELATIGGSLLLGALLFALQDWRLSAADGDVHAVRFLRPPVAVAANAFSQPRQDPTSHIVGATDLGTLQGVGRALFGDYLFQVELAGTVLLLATIGAMALSPRRSQGTL